MKPEETKLYTSAETYLNGPDGMKNEVDMWATAGGILVQESVRKYQWSDFGGLHDRIGIQVQQELEPISVLDLCSGPGNFANYLSLYRPDIQVTGIDTNEEFLEAARKRFSRYGWKFLNRDATDFDLGKVFDFVTASSAYHHIPDGKKVQFLQRIREHLASDAKVIMCEHFLPEYKNESAREKVVHMYYEALEAYYANGNATKQSRELLQEVRQLELSRTEEQKVDFKRFKEHVKESGLEIEVDRVVWQPEDFQSSNAGSHVLLLQAK